jgi:hypothetical protein
MSDKLKRLLQNRSQDHEGAGEGDRGPTEELTCGLGGVTKGHLRYFNLPFSNPSVVTRALFCRTAVALARPLVVLRSIFASASLACR